MEPTDPVAFVRYYNAWRVGGDMDMPDPSKITRALTELCDKVERLEREIEQERDASEDMRDLLKEVYNLTQLERDCPIDLPHRALVHIGHLIEEKTPPRRDPDNLEGPPPTGEERRENARAIQALTVPERFALMFGKRLQNETDEAGDPP